MIRVESKDTKITHDRCMKLIRFLDGTKERSKIVRDASFEIMAELIAHGKFFKRFPTEVEAYSDEYWAGQIEAWQQEKRDENKKAQKDLYRQNKGVEIGK